MRVRRADAPGLYGLPGGSPEPGEGAEATLERECLEESQITLATAIYLGYQEVTEPGMAHYAQLRYVARIASFQPHPPIWIGGSGRQRTPRAAARHADVWNAAGGTPQEIAALSAEPGQVLGIAEAFSAVGVTEILLLLGGDDPVAQAERTAELLPLLHAAA